ncbi:hypothetical protein EW146_g3493 [Bondarzewia mesenterica]|uniref:LIM zinc-binding domain-containing protein n=1 Tax=Bondarzewia mesenterica TaxID=1095465 RepID=A0A4S4LZ74_9AGAM|nr:hypothetical protein EW146_g3493 [Bondarzewia mesenterica]
MGPGRKLYHNNTIKSKMCHSRNFGTRDLRQANLPHRDDLVLLSPVRTGFSLSPTTPTTSLESSTPRRFSAETPTFSRRSAASPPPQPPRKFPQPITADRANTGDFSANLLRPTRTLSPTRATFNPSITSPISGDFATVDESDEGPDAETNGTGDHTHDDDGEHTGAGNLLLGFETPVRSVPTHVGRSQGGLPRTVPLTPDRLGTPTKQDRGTSTPQSIIPPATFGRAATTVGTTTLTLGRAAMSPLASTATGTRYGIGLTGGMRTNPTGRQWGGGTPQCPKCGKSVYFAEQVKAVGKTYHKACLRCIECNTSLDSSRLTEKDGQPMCHRCYGKVSEQLPFSRLALPCLVDVSSIGRDHSEFERVILTTLTVARAAR